MKKDKSEKLNTLTAHEAARNFIRPYILKGDTAALHSSANLRHETEDYSARIDGENVVITKLCGKEIHQQFPVKEIISGILQWNMCIIDELKNPSAKEVYLIRDEVIQCLLKSLRARLKNHKAKFSKDEKNWGYPGDLTRVEKLLHEIISFPW